MNGAPTPDSRVILAKSMRTVKCRDAGIDRDGECYIIIPADIDSDNYVNIAYIVVGEEPSSSMQTLLEILDARAGYVEEMFIDKGRRVG